MDAIVEIPASTFFVLAEWDTLHVLFHIAHVFYAEPSLYGGALITEFGIRQEQLEDQGQFVERTWNILRYSAL